MIYLDKIIETITYNFNTDSETAEKLDFLHGVLGNALLAETGRTNSNSIRWPSGPDQNDLIQEWQTRSETN